jgi:hypothetical protein
MALDKLKLKEYVGRLESLTKYLRGVIGEEGSSSAEAPGLADDDDDENLLPRSYGLDAKGRRLVRPPTSQARKCFEEEQGITRRRIRNLG